MFDMIDWLFELVSLIITHNHFDEELSSPFLANGAKASNVYNVQKQSFVGKLTYQISL